MSRDDNGTIVTVAGAAVLVLAFGGGYTRFVRPGMRVLLVVAGLLLVLLGLALLWRQWRARDPVDHVPRVRWLLLAPVFVLVLVAPASLGSYASGSGNDLLQLRRSYLTPLPPADGNPVDITFADALSRLRWDPATLRGRPLRLVGLVRPARGHPGQFTLLRYFIACCAADALPMTVQVRTTQPIPSRDQWVVVEGTLRVPAQPVGDGDLRPVLDATSVRPTSAPSQPYET